MSANLLDLEPETRALAQAAFAAWAREGLLLRPTQTLRTYAEQDAIYAKGRTVAGEPCWHKGVARPVGSCVDHPLGATVTRARGGWSWHCHARAFDVCQIGHEPYPRSEAFWEKAAHIAESVGLECGIHFPVPDEDHFEHRGGFTLAQLRARHDQPNLA